MSEWEEWVLAFVQVANEMMDEMETHPRVSPCDTCEHNGKLADGGEKDEREDV